MAREEGRWRNLMRLVWSRAKAERNRGEDVWIASDGQKENHQVKCGNEGE